MMQANINFTSDSACISGDVNYGNIAVIRKQLQFGIKNKNINFIDLTAISGFDTSAVVLICSIQAWSRSRMLKITWNTPEKMQILLKLYGIEKYFERK